MVLKMKVERTKEQTNKQTVFTCNGLDYIGGNRAQPCTTVLGIWVDWLLAELPYLLLLLFYFYFSVRHFEMH